MGELIYEDEIIISDPEAVKRLYEFMMSDEAAEPRARKTYSYEERVRCEELLRQYFSRSKQ